MELDALKKRMADMDRDNRKLSHEREELARAYKDADAGKQKALDRVALLEKELAKMKAEFEKKFGGAREEIDVLTRKLAESESRLKVEVEGIKKKMAITITELEMSLAGSLQQYDITIKRLTQIEAEFKSVTLNYNNTIKVVKDYELKMGGLTKQVTELTSINNNFGQLKVKLEKDLAAV